MDLQEIGAIVLTIVFTAGTFYVLYLAWRRKP